MASSIEYRQRAEEQRRLAVASALPMVRIMHDKAADRWDCLAEAAELSELSSLATSSRAQEVFY